MSVLNSDQQHQPLSLPEVQQEKSGLGDFLSALLPLFVSIIVCVGYHFICVQPLFVSATVASRIYYTADLNQLIDSKVVQMLKAADNKGEERDEITISREIDQFRDKIAGDLLELSNGYPIFQRDAVINARDDIVDLTVVVAQRNGLDLKESLDDFLKAQRPTN